MQVFALPLKLVHAHICPLPPAALITDGLTAVRLSAKGAISLLYLPITVTVFNKDFSSFLNNYFIFSSILTPFCTFIVYLIYAKRMSY